MNVLAILATLLVLMPGPAPAQTGTAPGGIRDGLGGVGIAGSRRVHGHVVLVKGDTVILRTDDGRTLAVDAARTDARIRGPLRPGDGVTVVTRASRERGSRTDTPVASQLERDGASRESKPYLSVDGTVAEVTGARVVFKTHDGFRLPLDVSAISGLAPLSPGEPATLTYEARTGQAGIQAVWIEPGHPAPAASPTTAPSTPRSDVQRVHGLVEAITLTGFSLASDDGRKLMVQTIGSSTDVRPGDLVTVSGHLGGSPDTIVAGVVQPDPEPR